MWVHISIHVIISKSKQPLTLDIYLFIYLIPGCGQDRGQSVLLVW